VLQDETHNKITLSEWEILHLICISVPTEGAEEKKPPLWRELACLWVEGQAKKQAGCFAGCVSTIRHLNSTLNKM